MAQLMHRALHVRIDGRSQELSLAALKLDASATDGQIKRAVERHLDLRTGYLNSYAVSRTSQAIIVRPEAIYG